MVHGRIPASRAAGSLRKLAGDLSTDEDAGKIVVKQPYGPDALMPHEVGRYPEMCWFLRLGNGVVLLKKSAIPSGVSVLICMWMVCR